MYGSDGTQNATHGSDSPTSALREIKFYFPGLVMEPLPADMAKDYITQVRLQSGDLLHAAHTHTHHDYYSFCCSHSYIVTHPTQHISYLLSST
jgi:hypothetical protein